jgi:hypothetical protein
LVIILSDFIDQDYEDLLISLGNKHDVVALQIQDQNELQIPALGIIPIFNPETGKTSYLNASSKSFKKMIDKQFVKKAEELSSICQKQKIDYVRIVSGEDYVQPLVKLFTIRK